MSKSYNAYSFCLETSQKHLQGSQCLQCNYFGMAARDLVEVNILQNQKIHSCRREQNRSIFIINNIVTWRAKPNGYCALSSHIFFMKCKNTWRSCQNVKTTQQTS